MSTVDTYGWHTVAAITYADVNKAIAASGKVPASFSATAPDSSTSANNVTFGVWSLAFGGSGADISMQIGVTGGSITGPFGVGGDRASLPISATTFPILVKANYVPHVDDSTVLNLVLDHRQPVSVGAYSGAAPTTNSLANAALRGLLQQWLIENINEFNMVFASVDLDASYKSEGLNWLAPSFRGYAVSEPPTAQTMDNCVFAVLCLVDGALAPTNISYAVSPYAIPAGANAAFLINGEKFLEHMMFAALPAMFDGVPAGQSAAYFDITNDGSQITNSKPLQLNKVQLDNGKIVSPNVDPLKFTVQLDGQELVMSISDMSFELSAGVSVHLTYTCRAKLTYGGANATGAQKGLSLVVDSQSGHGWIEVSKGLQIAEYITGGLALLTALLGGIGGIYSAPATAIAEGTTVTLTRGINMGQDIEMVGLGMQAEAGVIISNVAAPISRFSSAWLLTTKIALAVGFLSGLMPMITEVIKAVADGKYDSMPEITELTHAAIGQTVIWPASVSDYTLASAQLNGALQFGLAKSK